MEMKTMLVDKINKFITGEPKIDEVLLEEVGNLSKHAFNRQFMDRGEDKNGIRLSSAGKCARAQAYDHLGFTPEGKTIDARGRMVFWLGDMVELTVIALAKLSGVKITKCGLDQIDVFLEVGGEKIEGHPDGIIEHEGEKFLFECKSMTDFSFKDFERGVVNDTYLYQINAYMDCLGLDKCCFVAINKQSGVLSEKIINKNDVRVQFVKDNIQKVLSSTKENLPKRAYESGKTGFYPWQCAYCSHYKTCLIDTGLAERVVVRNAYKLKSLKGGES